MTRKQLSTNTDGWKSMPIEPTDEMIRAACDDQGHDPADGLESEVYHYYKAMINAISQGKGESV